MQKTITINKKKIKIYFKRKYDDQYVYLNAALIRKQNLTIKQIKSIIWTHKRIDSLFIYIQNDPECDFEKAAKYYHILQFKLQHEWNFERNINYHRFWELPKCTCPKLDNEDRYPCGYYISNTNCPLHGYK